MEPDWTAMPLGAFGNWTVPAVARRRGESHADNPFVNEIDGGGETYAQFVSHARSLATYFKKLGTQKEDRIGIFCRNGIPALHGWLAANLVGAVDASINASLRGEPLRHVLRTTLPRLILTEAALLATLRDACAVLDYEIPVLLIDGPLELEDLEAGGRPLPLHDYAAALREPELDWRTVEAAPADPAAVMFTSGTTGPSKAVLMPHGQVCMLAQQVILNTGLEDRDVFYCVHPLNHIAGKFMGVFASFVVGARVVLDRRFDAATWLRNVRAHGITTSIAHGPMIEMIHRAPPSADDRDHAMRRLMCCPMPKAIGRAFEQRFDLSGIEMWGMTEVACPCWTPAGEGRIDGSCGRPMEDWYDIRIADPGTGVPLPPGRTGELTVRPKHVATMMLEYMNNPEATVKAWRDLWFHTGDAAWRDEDGNFYIVDRIQDRIRRRAENISSYDIEQAALAMPAIREAAAVGVPSDMEGDDDIKLCIVTDTPLDHGELLRHLALWLPHFMLPRYVERHDALPRTPTNKVRKRELRENTVPGRTWDRQESGIRIRDLYPGS